MSLYKICPIEFDYDRGPVWEPDEPECRLETVQTTSIIQTGLQSRHRTYAVHVRLCHPVQNVVWENVSKTLHVSKTLTFTA
jgi:hypothetical protein